MNRGIRHNQNRQRPSEVRAESLVERTLLGSDAVSPDRFAQQLGVAGLFEPLKGERVTRQ